MTSSGAFAQTPIVALDKCATYDDPEIENRIRTILDASGLSIATGMQVLVKPNLLQNFKLACSSPVVVAFVCKWLLDHGAVVTVADSPGFGSATQVARGIGLEKALQPLGLRVSNLGSPKQVTLRLPARNGLAEIRLPVSEKALKCDLVLAVAKIKAHKQMLMTLGVKNCFGCVPGIRKALVHARYGEYRDFFADCVAAIWAALPPVAAFADGVIAMHVTGPTGGKPYPLQLLGASTYAPALDAAILETLKIPAHEVPLHAALMRRDATAWQDIKYPLAKPDDFDSRGFRVPEKLVSTSFHPAQLARSIVKRLWKKFAPGFGKK